MNPRLFHNGKVQLYAGDCMEVLSGLTENSIDAVVTDPPYHLTSIVKRFANAKPEKEAYASTSNSAYMSRGFMGKVWDGGDIAFRPELWAEVLRVLKPGGHMVAFSGTRTYHRMTVASEDAGFEIRDQLAWVFGSGFPKSHDVSKGIDRMLGAEREVVGQRRYGKDDFERSPMVRQAPRGTIDVTAPATDAARQWQGYGTALKPSWEPICLARKPLSEGTIAANVLRWGTGALNIDGCRIGTTVETRPKSRSFASGISSGYTEGLTKGATQGTGDAPAGRWPANLLHDGSPEVLAGFPETGVSNGGGMKDLRKGKLFLGETNPNLADECGFGDTGSAARFFYTAKANADDRLNSKHPTVKPVDLMQWLVKFVCPKGATVLDPFAGTGTTGAASFIEGRRCVLIEREAEYLADVERRMELLLSGSDERSWRLAKPESLEALPLFALTEPAA